MNSSHKKKTALLIGIAGSKNAFSLSLYNIKAYAQTDPEIKDKWHMPVIQHPLINIGAFKIQAENELKILSDQVIAQKPDLVAFSCYMWNSKVFEKLASIIRRELPSTLILWGGPEMTTDYILEGLYDDYEADFCISGEGELTFLELLRNLTQGNPQLSEIKGLSYRTNGKGAFKVNEKRIPFKSLLEIPSPFLNDVVDQDVLKRKGVEANLETQRGCTLRCSYCIYHKDMGKISYNAVDRIINEVLYVCRQGVKRIRFVDANFSSDLDHAKAVIKALIKENIEAKIMFELIPGFIDEELAALFGEFNDLHDWNAITLGIGVQTINYEVLKKMRRGIRLKAFEKTFELLEKYKIYAKIDLIIGLPGEDIQSIQRTLEYFLDRLRYSSAHLLCCHVMRGLPGTELLTIAKEHKMEFSSKYEPHELISSPLLPRKDMLKCLRMTAVIFRLVNHEGWANREFIRGETSQKMTVRDAFFAARERMGISNIELIEALIEKLIPELKKRNSNFSQPDFPYAESWWWTWSKMKISDKLIFDLLNSFEKEAHREPPLIAEKLN